MKAQGLSAAAIAKALGIGRERLTTEADRQQAVWRGRSMRRMSLLTEVGVNKVSLVYWSGVFSRAMLTPRSSTVQRYFVASSGRIPVGRFWNRPAPASLDCRLGMDRSKRLHFFRIGPMLATGQFANSRR